MGTQIIDDSLFDKAFNLFSRIENQDFEYVYRGFFSHNISKKILSLADVNIQKTLGQSTFQKRIYYIMVEGLQNITMHQDEIEEGLDKYPGIFAIQKQGHYYYITTGNLVLNEKIPPLKEKIEQINKLDKEGLKQLHKEILRSGVISEKGGAGLGLIEMARKSGNKLVASFELVNEQYSYFYLQTKIPTTKEVPPEEDNPENMRKALRSIKKLHITLNVENILLYFNGFFTQENLLNLLSIVKGRMNLSLTTIRLSNIMVEMIQNIIKHGEKALDNKGVPGIFFLRQLDNGDFALISGNYVNEKQKYILEEKLKFINSSTIDEISEMYDKVLLDMDNFDAIHTGLGLYDLRIKSPEKLQYKFLKIDQNRYFYILQTIIKNKD